MRNTVQQFIRKCANFCIKFCSMNEELNLLKVSVLKIRFQTALRAQRIRERNVISLLRNILHYCSVHLERK